MYHNSKVITVAWIAFLAMVLSIPVWGAVTPEKINKIKEAAPAQAAAKPKQPRKLLVIDLCKGYKHSSIPYWDEALKIMGEKTGAYTTVISSDLNMLKPENIKQFDAVCFNNTTKLGLNPQDTPEICKGLMDFVKGGKGIVGIHAAVDNFYKWPEMAQIMGNRFSGHPWGGNGTWAIKIDDPQHPLTQPFNGKGFKVNDEIYETLPPLYSRGKQRVLMSLDMSDEDTEKMVKRPEDRDTGISWIKVVDKGRVFYCAMGHTHHLTWTTPIMQHVLDGIQFAFGDLVVDTTPIPGLKQADDELKEVDDLVAKAAGYEYGKSREALVKLEDIIRGAYKKPELLSKIEQRLIGALNFGATTAGMDFICRQLSKIGTEASVDALAKLLVKKETSDMARFALERIPGKKVDVVLRDALTKTSGNEKIGVISTLGLRRDTASVPILAGLIQDSDRSIADAAVTALGQIGNEEAVEALKKTQDTTKDSLRTMVLDAYLRCGDQLADQGKKKQAMEIYRQAYQDDEPAIIRIAALRGMVTVAGEDVSELLINILKGDDKQMKSVAIGLVSEIPGEKMTRALTKELPSLAPLGQVQLLSALAQRGDAGALPAVIKAAKSSNSEVCQMALQVLGVLGNESTVMLLAETAAKSSGAEQDAARESLYRLRGEEVDKTILANISHAAPKVKLELVKSIGQRGIKDSAPILLQTAQDSDKMVQRESFKVLSDIAQAEHLTPLIDLLVKSTSSSGLREAEKAVVAVIRKTENEGITEVLKAMRSVSDVKVRCSLLSVLGKAGDARALPELRKALNDSNTDVKRAAILALTEWPNADAASDLLAAAKSETSTARQVLALRGYIKLVSLPSKRSAAGSVKMLADGLALAKRDDEKKAVLAALPGCACEEALKLAQSLEQDPALAAEAKSAVEKIKANMAKK